MLGRLEKFSGCLVPGTTRGRDENYYLIPGFDSPGEPCEDGGDSEDRRNTGDNDNGESQSPFDHEEVGKYGFIEELHAEMDDPTRLRHGILRCQIMTNWSVTPLSDVEVNPALDVILINFENEGNKFVVVVQHQEQSIESNIRRFRRAQSIYSGAKIIFAVVSQEYKSLYLESGLPEGFFQLHKLSGTRTYRYCEDNLPERSVGRV